MFRNIITIILILFSIVSAKEIQVVFPPSTPPYVFENATGIAVTIVKEALEYKSHTLNPVFINTKRGIELFNYGYVDATAIIKKSSGLKAYYSNPFIEHHNVVFALKSNNYNINDISDMRKYNIIAFQNAKEYLGLEFAKLSRSNYLEVANQKQAVYKLLKGRTDLVIMDKSIFKYYKKELIAQGKVDKNINVEIYELFEPSKYKIAFKDKEIRDDFNDGIKYLQTSGRCNEIYNLYSEKYFKVKK